MTLRRLVLSAMAGFTAGFIYLHSDVLTRTSEQVCSVYRDYKRNLFHKKPVNFFFDFNETPVIGDSSLVRQLQVGEEYCFTLKKSIFPWEKPIISMIKESRTIPEEYRNDSL